MISEIVVSKLFQPYLAATSSLVLVPPPVVSSRNSSYWVAEALLRSFYLLRTSLKRSFSQFPGKLFQLFPLRDLGDKACFAFTYVYTL